MSETAISNWPLWRQPLFHFLLAGAAIFALDAARDTPESAASNRIVVTVAQIERIAGLWQKTWGRAPSEAELQALVRDHIREEVYYREALKLGLDVNDTVIRRRLRQKMEFLTADDVAISKADDVTLRTYYEQNAERYRKSPVFDFMQVYFSLADDPAATDVRTNRALEALRDGASPDGVGEPIGLPRTMTRADESGIARTFGSVFYGVLNTLEPGVWSGPVASGFGQHLVKISNKEAAQLPALADIRAVVENDWQAERNSASRDAAYGKLRARYAVEIEVPAE